MTLYKLFNVLPIYLVGFVGNFAWLFACPPCQLSPRYQGMELPQAADGGMVSRYRG